MGWSTSALLMGSCMRFICEHREVFLCLGHWDLPCRRNSLKRLSNAQVVLQALKKTSEERFRTIEQFAQTLHAALQVHSSTDLMTQPSGESASDLPTATASQLSVQPSPSPKPAIPHSLVTASVSPEVFSFQTIRLVSADVAGELYASPPRPLGASSLPLGERQTPQPHLQPAHAGEMPAILDSQQMELALQTPLAEDEPPIIQGSRACSSQFSPAHTGPWSLIPITNGLQDAHLW